MTKIRFCSILSRLGTIARTGTSLGLRAILLCTLSRGISKESLRLLKDVFTCGRRIVPPSCFWANTNENVACRSLKTLHTGAEAHHRLHRKHGARAPLCHVTPGRSGCTVG